MSPSPVEAAYLAKRARLLGAWPVVGGVLLALLAAFAAWLWFEVPFMLDPWAVSAALESDTLPTSTLQLMALLLPIVMLVLLVFAAAVVLLTFAAVSNERRLIRMLEREGS